MILKDMLFILLPVVGVMMGMIFEHKFCINEIEQIKSDIECLKNDIGRLQQQKLDIECLKTNVRCLHQQIEIMDKAQIEIIDKAGRSGE